MPRRPFKSLKWSKDLLDAISGLKTFYKSCKTGKRLKELLWLGDLLELPYAWKYIMTERPLKALKWSKDTLKVIHGKRTFNQSPRTGTHFKGTL